MNPSFLQYLLDPKSTNRYIAPPPPQIRHRLQQRQTHEQKPKCEMDGQDEEGPGLRWLEMTAADRLWNLWQDNYSLADWTHLSLTVRTEISASGRAAEFVVPEGHSHIPYPTSRRGRRDNTIINQRYRLLLRENCDVSVEVVILPLEAKVSSQRQDLHCLKF
jgi:hypothetical protein